MAPRKTAKKSVKKAEGQQAEFPPKRLCILKQHALDVARSTFYPADTDNSFHAGITTEVGILGAVNPEKFAVALSEDDLDDDTFEIAVYELVEIRKFKRSSGVVEIKE